MTHELEKVICIGGSAGSGKSALAAALADHFAVDRASFSEVLRLDAERSGIEVTRRNLQDLGQARIESGWPAFVRAVVGLVGWPPPIPCIIEGIRHPAALAECKRQASGVSVHFILLEVDAERRDERILSRGSTRGVEDRLDIDSHQVESEVTSLRSVADVVLCDGNVSDWVNAIVGSLE